MDQISTRAGKLSDTLHRSLATGNGRCYLLIDVSPRPLDENNAFDAAVLSRSSLQVESPVNDVDTSQMPLLIELDSNRAGDSLFISETIEEALAESQPESLARGRGRRVCGWLVSSASINQLAAHIAECFVIRQSPGHTRKLRWFDPAVLWALWPILTPTQRNRLIFPIDAYWLLDPGGHWLTLGRSRETEASPSLDFNAEQLAEIGRIAALNRCLREWGAAHAQSSALDTARATASAALRRAAGFGFSSTGDLAAFASRALTAHPNFDSHPLVSERLNRRESDDYFTALVDDLTPMDWERIRTETAVISESP